MVYDEVQYTKNDWRNRNKIKTAKGAEWITIPVRQQSLNQTIDDTLVLNDLWQKKHPRMLQANYSKAPFYKQIMKALMPLYEKPDFEMLSEVNYLFINALCGILGVKTKIVNSRELGLQGDRQMRLVDACKKLNANCYLSGPSAKSYIQEAVFEANDIKVEWMDYSSYPEYPQLFPPFAHEVSILDLLFNVGPEEAKKYMKSFKER